MGRASTAEDRKMRFIKRYTRSVIISLGINAEVDGDDWRGKVTDSYRGFNVFGTFYF